ncbi:MAG: carbohydrate kinase [Gammaproteobacteria bacterium]|nr:carbohydrate kinase [Gammaproteobacteria bacterium]NIT63398.1 carbohydrate kinase [Gammaproteobacteria bacterium]NIX10205.1 carbohydrate kinase [Gammaproteobacteria bacterium]NIY31978.1 carbohydrate kinase [Gammaproteobacteria bacterium]
MNHRGRPVIFGEVLFDRFEDGTSVLGGAPFNVAWHLQGLGLRPLFVSRVGDDMDGAHILRTMEAWGMDNRGVQVDPERPTGAVQVALQGGQPTFDILPERAYDYIDAAAAGALLASEDCALLYHGTLITRSAVSRASLAAQKEALALPVFVDVNLRPPWWDASTLKQALAQARWAKLNEHELASVLERDAVARADLEPAAQALCADLGLDLLIVTLGGEGACIVHAGNCQCGAPVPVASMMDTVGAGDAFSAVAILGLVEGWPYPQILSRALGFASAVCAIRGATTTDRALYSEQQDRWKNER